ncbi:MAG: exosortase A [Burkholderiales bacterium]
MKLESEEVLHPMHATALSRSSWLWSAAVALGALVWLLLWYRETTASMVSIWERSETFAHGYLIAPIAAYLIWTRRQELARIVPQPDARGLLVLLGLGLLWLVAGVADVLVVKQYALVAMIPGVVYTLLGREVLWAMAFPMAFLMLAVPNGEALIPPMMEFTADFTVGMLQLTGIPVYREGLFFTLPSGDWSVVEGCSGLRYLIASITGGCLYAYLYYRSMRRRLIFIAASIVVPVIANGFRAYMIVMIAHLSDMKLALGVDHFVYGWVWFGIVMFLMFWVGSYWREDEPEAAVSNEPGAPPHRISGTQRKLAVVCVSLVLIAGAWPLYASYLASKWSVAGSLALAAPTGQNAWNGSEENFTNWSPHYQGADKTVYQVYRKENQPVGLFMAYYRSQGQDTELINSQNVMVAQKHPVWSNVGESVRHEEMAQSGLAVRETKLRSASQRLLIWDWNSIAEKRFVNAHYGKLLQARERIFGGSGEGAALILAVPYDEDIEGARTVLRDFIKGMMPAINESLRKAKPD